MLVTRNLGRTSISTIVSIYLHTTPLSIDYRFVLLFQHQPPFKPFYEKLVNPTPSRSRDEWI